MTPEEAKSILSTCRADYLDTENPDVRQALDVAAHTPQLATWWETEQAFDRAFSRKLLSIQAPKALEEAILQGGATIFAARRLITETKSDANTEELIEKNTPSPIDSHKVVLFYSSPAELAALAKPAPPPPNPFPFPNRAERPNALTRPAERRPWRLMLPWSLAASFLLALLALSIFFDPGKLTADPDAELPAFTKTAEGIADAPAPPDQPGQQVADLLTYLASHNAPTPAALPAPVASAKIVGESVSSWKKDTISLVRLRDASGNLTLFILNKTDFPHDHVPAAATVTVDGPDTITTWSDAADIYVLLRKTP